MDAMLMEIAVANRVMVEALDLRAKELKHILRETIRVILKNHEKEGWEA